MPTVGTPLLLVLDARFHSKHKRIPGNTQSYVTHPPGTNFRADVLRNTEGTQNDNGGVVGSISWRPFHRRVAWRLHLLSPSPRKSGSKFVVRGCGIMRVARYLRLLSMPCTAEHRYSSSFVYIPRIPRTCATITKVPIALQYWPHARGHVFIRAVQSYS